ncbi:zinc transporter ZntB [Shewanella sp. GXUN23E]|uniref:zinc transporter ZntB n=1 Tax=Shewanella sp. GXUN23E TaxID=3422498 RepID=UPI003D7F1895
MSKSFVFNLLINPQTGEAKELSQDELQQWQPDQGILWLHMNYRNPDAQKWLKQAGLSLTDTQTLLAPDTRPKVEATAERILMTLRGINLNPESDPEDMVAVRLYADTGRIITSSDRKVKSIGELAEHLLLGKGPTTPGSFILELCHRLTLRKVNMVTELEDKLADQEEAVLQSNSGSPRAELAELRRQVIAIRRYLAPQKEAFFNVINTPSMMTVEEKTHMREIYNTLLRVIEDLDSIRDRAMVTQEELANQMTEQLNKRLYFLSLITAIFLPLGFLTGLLGVNIGGIPGVDDPHAFGWFTLGLLTLIFIQLGLLYRFRWLRK